uniref:Uncharacterized protein n=1 Tax=Arundo donax TaxID=35708 RepID=A0A0A9DBE2_ARUDO
MDSIIRNRLTEQRIQEHKQCCRTSKRIDLYQIFNQE